MVILLDGADFSANNIGQIQIDVPMQDETIAILNRFSITPTSAIKNALNSFIIKLKNANILRLIDKMAFPCLASNVTEAVQDALNGNGVVMDNENKAKVVLRNKGIGYASIESQPVASFNSFSESGNNIHICAYNNSSVTKGSEDVVVFSQSGVPFFKCCASLPYVQGKFDGSTNTKINASNTGVRTVTPRPHLYSRVDGNAGYYNDRNESYTGNSVVDGADTSITSVVMLCYGIGKNCYFDTELGFFSVGKGMTVEQSKTFYDIVDEFMKIAIG